ncbi:G1/S-specific cyclin-E1 [Tyrophagus putrescentiae]|nr:G1/S-specific cyclin-E1 [Tyrophagus putrescentiae]
MSANYSSPVEAFYSEPSTSSHQKKSPLKTSIQENCLTPEKKSKRLKPSKEDYENVQIQTSIELTPCSLIASSSYQHPTFLPENIPLPQFEWANSTEVWRMMVKAEEYYHRDADMFGRHPSLQPVMRAMLLDWLNEVCQAYTLSRQTYYLALDFFDRYLSTKRDICKKRLQLLGITCLFIASKIEEIFPPKLDRFSFVCDGACDDKEILAKEQLVLNTLNWELSPLTPNSWLNVYMQIYSNNVLNKPCDKENAPDLSSGERFLFPNFESKLFVQIAHLIDLCTLNAGSLAFPYSVIAASAFYHFTNEDVVLQCTGKTMEEMSACIEWMIPFAIAIKNEGLEFVDKLLEDSSDRSITIQSHTVNLDLLKSAQSIQAEIESNKMAPLDSSDTGVETGTSTLTPSKFPPTPPRS